MTSPSEDGELNPTNERNTVKVYTIAETLALQAGTPITAISGIIKRVHPPATGQGKFGPYHLQRVDIEDGAETTLNIDGHDPLYDDSVGHRIYAIAGTGKGGDPTGVKTSVYTASNGTQYHRVDVKKSATLSWNPPGGASTAAPAAPRPAASNPPPPAAATRPAANPPSPRSAPPQSPAPSGPQPAGDWSKVDTYLGRMRRLHLRALQCARRIQIDAEAVGVTLSAGLLEGIHMNLVISSERAGMVAHVPRIDPPGIGANAPALNRESAPTPPPATPPQDPENREGNNEVDDIHF